MRNRAAKVLQNQIKAFLVKRRTEKCAKILVAWAKKCFVQMEMKSFKRVKEVCSQTESCPLKIMPQDVCEIVPFLSKKKVCSYFKTFLVKKRIEEWHKAACLIQKYTRSKIVK